MLVQAFLVPSFGRQALMTNCNVALHRSPIARMLIIFGSALAMLTIGSNETALASSGCDAINALATQHLAPSGQYGMGLMGQTWSPGDAITLAGTPSANIYVSAWSGIENYIDNRFANTSGGRATFVILPSETNAWLGWGMWANSNSGGLTVTISCKPVPSSSNACPPDTRKVTKNGHVTCVCIKGGLGECN
jgi:hypothetical protein